VGSISLESILATTDLSTFKSTLESSNCKRCSLCEQDVRIVVSRGALDAQVMLVGEAPGAVEDQCGQPFSGPAGELLDKAFAADNINTKLELYITNVCKCRPIAPEFSGKQNYTPRAEQRRQCLPYLLHEIALLNPSIVVACGAVAAEALFQIKQPKMSQIAGRIIDISVPVLQDKICYVMYHPAYVLHQKRAGQEVYTKARKALWEQILTLKELMYGRAI